VPSIIQQWLGEQVAALVFICFALLMGLALVYFSAQCRRSTMVRDRSGRTEETFSEYFAACGFDPRIARATYRYLRQVQQIAFPIEPLDDLDRTLGLNCEDLNQTVRDLLAETGREYLPGLLDSPLVTVLDLVRYLQVSPRREFIPRRRIA
jgi:hypothetical protein